MRIVPALPDPHPGVILGTMTIRKRALSRQICGGTWINLGSSVSAEIAANAGFDWLLMDLEHGIGGYEILIHQLQAMNGSPAAPIVRVQENNWGQIKKVLDYGAAGVMVPYVQTRAEAEAAVSNIKYPPQGKRGAARLTRASQFGQGFEAYFRSANQETLTIVQIETPLAVENAAAIAAVEDVDVLFVGPLDLTVTKFDGAHEVSFARLHEDMERVAAACRSQGKACGTLLTKPEDLTEIVALGYTFIALGSDGGCLVHGLNNNAEVFKRLGP